MATRQATMTLADAQQRAATAREHLSVAEERLSYVPTTSEPSAAAQVSASNSILAGIAAADAICGKALGVRANDQDHNAAAVLVATVTPDGPDLAKRLRRLVKDKSQIQYGQYVTTARAADMFRQASALVESMTKILIL